jgi:aspartyl-tRNA(Asn)/glutamyl-tRNA(Gln) amidotransferase subunit A
VDLKSLTIKTASELLSNREISSVELTRAYLAAIEKQDKDINAFISVYPEEAIAQAKEADKRLGSGEKLHVLTGIPGAIKDNILVKGQRATAGSKMLENYIASYEAAAARLLREAGAVFLGKTNLDEFAMGSSTENSAFGPTRNPYDLDRVPGGSSGGSAAAVGDNIALWALGSDTGGSIRQPAGFCGVVGLKPTYGAVSRYGLIAMASSLDQIGPITKTVEDAEIVFNAIKGRDVMDSTSVKSKIKNQKSKLQFKIQNLKIGVPKEYFAEGIEPVVEQAVRSAMKKLETAGAQIIEISLPHTEYALACYYIIQPAEVSSNLARYDGIRYGSRNNAEGNAEQRGKTQRNPTSSPRKSALEGLYFETRGGGFGTEVKRRIMLGTYVLSAGYYDAYYAKAQQVRRLIRDDFVKAFEKIDVIIAPTSPTLPFKFGEKTSDPVSMYLADIYTVSANLAGIPALSLPCGYVSRISPENSTEQRGTDADQRGTNQRDSALSPRESAVLSVGLQIMGKHFDEKTILRVGNAIELEARD